MLFQGSPWINSKLGYAYKKAGFTKRFITYGRKVNEKLVLYDFSQDYSNQVNSIKSRYFKNLGKKLVAPLGPKAFWSILVSPLFIA